MEFKQEMGQTATGSDPLPHSVRDPRKLLPLAPGTWGQLLALSFPWDTLMEMDF